MDKDEIEQGRLLEALILNRDLAEARTSLFSNYGGHPDWWNYYGNPWVVPARHNPRGYFDVRYTNSEGKLHRIYGPAYISRLFNIEAWYKDGKLHRENGPAYTHNHNSVWFQDGQLHRLDGPAVIEDAGPKQYWIRGIKFTKKQYLWEIRRMKKRGKIK